MTTPDSPEGLTVEELARLKAIAEKASKTRPPPFLPDENTARRFSDQLEFSTVCDPAAVLALITQVERLTEERDGLLASIREAVEMLGDEAAHWGEAIKRLKAIADARREMTSDG